LRGVKIANFCRLMVAVKKTMLAFTFFAGTISGETISPTTIFSKLTLTTTMVLAIAFVGSPIFADGQQETHTPMQQIRNYMDLLTVLNRIAQGDEFPKTLPTGATYLSAVTARVQQQLDQLRNPERILANSPSLREQTTPLTAQTAQEILERIGLTNQLDPQFRWYWALIHLRIRGELSYDHAVRFGASLCDRNLAAPPI